MAGRRAVRSAIRTASLWCGVGALLAVPALTAPPAAAAGTVALAPAASCLTSGPIRHAAAGIDFGGKELPSDAAGTRTVVRGLLSDARLLPDGAAADPGRSTVTLRDGSRTFTVTVTVVRMPGDLPYAPVALAHVRNPQAAVVRVSDRAAPDLVREAVVARLAELAVVARHRWQNERPDVTSGLTDGLLTTTRVDGTIPLSPRDTGRIQGLASITGTGSKPLVVLGAAAAMGLLDTGDIEPHSMPGNRPLAGEKAAAVRIATVRGFSAAARTAVARVLALSAEQSAAVLASIRAERECERRALRSSSDQLIAARDGQDRRLTKVLDGEFARHPVIPHLIVGAGWAGTVDYLTFDPSAANANAAANAAATANAMAANATAATANAANATAVTAAADPKVPSVLVLGGGPGVVNSLGDFRLTQSAMDLELPEAPFQPNDFVADHNDFTTSTAFGRAVGVARALAGMPTYRASLSRIEARPAGAAATDWPVGAGYRLTTSEGRALYAHTVDLTTGLGPPRLPDTDVSPLKGRAFKDPRTNWRVEFDQAGQVKVFDAQGRPSSGPLPEESSWLLGVSGQGASLASRRRPFLLDPEGRPTEYRVVDQDSRYSVDPDTGAAYDPDGGPTAPGQLDPEVRRRLGFGPGPGFAFRDPRFLADRPSGLSVNPVTGAVINTVTGQPPRTRPSVEVQQRLDALVRAHRVQFGGQNTAADYAPTGRVYIVGGGAGGASEVEQATGLQRQVIWGARAKVPASSDLPGAAPGAVDPQYLWQRYLDAKTPPEQRDALRDLSFMSGGGYNRRNTLPGIGAYSLAVWDQVARTIDLPTGIRYATDHRFLTTGPGGPVPCDRLVYTIGQEAGHPGGAAALLGSTQLTRLDGPGNELNGLRDLGGGLRVLGAAGVAGAVTKLIDPFEEGLDVQQINEQARALPPDARDIQPSIRYHAFRIAELNRTFGTQP